ncbi:hypothetical protein [Streptomyces evansiae]|uniref:hypothetical protein n=1 Tax=Streptomyces evansiae TaxID=3075535 RepID=UPI002888289E|nr:hypothetical protein [Streptomyces sp. DSM 41859]MDT0422976.1 hypothetical protein [Streptomyces sp. DSM 41859]
MKTIPSPNTRTAPSIDAVRNVLDGLVASFLDDETLYDDLNLCLEGAQPPMGLAGSRRRGPRCRSWRRAPEAPASSEELCLLARVRRSLTRLVRIARQKSEPDPLTAPLSPLVERAETLLAEEGGAGAARVRGRLRMLGAVALDLIEALATVEEGET